MADDRSCSSTHSRREPGKDQPQSEEGQAEAADEEPTEELLTTAAEEGVPYDSRVLCRHTRGREQLVHRCAGCSMLRHQMASMDQQLGKLKGGEP